MFVSELLGRFSAGTLGFWGALNFALNIASNTPSQVGGRREVGVRRGMAEHGKGAEEGRMYTGAGGRERRNEGEQRRAGEGPWQWP